MKQGQEVICDLDGKRYVIVSITDRNLVEKKNPDDPPRLMGNVVLLIDEQGNQNWCYEWEITEVSNETND
jgi:hypothetical protein